MNEPSEARSAAMMYTETTDTCPQSWISPVDVPSGVGLAISAAYCMPRGSTATRKNPSSAAKA